METNLVLLGLAFFVAAEIFISVRVWRLGYGKFSVPLLFPGHDYLLARRKAFHWPYYLMMACGAALFLAAAIASSFK